MTRSFSASEIPYLGIVGWSNSGKTTLLEALIEVLQERGYRIAVVKHTHHRDVETDLPGTDSRRLWEAGASHTAFWTPERVVHTHRWSSPPPLGAVLEGVHDVDLIIIEGYKRGTFPKIEVIRADREPILIPELEGRIACVTDVPDLACDVSIFGPDAVEAIADFIVVGFLARKTEDAGNG